MLARVHRLRRSADFRAALRGIRAGRATLVVHLALAEPGAPRRTFTASAGLPAARVGFAVSRAVGSAVTRHHVTRRLRHLAAERVATLPGGTLVVVRAQPRAATATFPELRADFTAALDAALSKATR